MSRRSYRIITLAAGIIIAVVVWLTYTNAGEAVSSQLDVPGIGYLFSQSAQVGRQLIAKFVGSVGYSL